jgi:hypothetical protein
MRRTLYSAEAAVYVGDGPPVWRITGVLDAKSLPAIVESAGLMLRDAPGFIADYRLTRVAVDVESMASCTALSAGPHSALAAPVAVVINPDYGDVWASYAWKMAQRGLVRGVFTDATSAQAWVERQAYIHWQEAARRAAIHIEEQSTPASAPTLAVRQIALQSPLRMR